MLFLFRRITPWLCALGTTVLLGAEASTPGSARIHSPEPLSKEAVKREASAAGSSLLHSIQDEETVYLFSHFVGNGEAGLHLAYSRDAKHWTHFPGNPSWLTPTVGGKLMRDPCIIQGPDGVFHMVHTTSWGDRGIGIAHSRDLITWYGMTFLPVMEHQPKAVNCWAPEIFFDARTDQYVIYWSTTIEGAYPETIKENGDKHQGIPLNHRVYCTTTRDFNTYTRTKLFYEPGFNVIDPVIIRLPDKDKQPRYAMVLKDETRHPDQKNLRVAVSHSVFGPWKTDAKPFSPDWVEGPALLPMGDAWICYYDMYTRHRYGAMQTRDFKTWTDITGDIRFPKGTRHGTAFRVTGKQFNKLLRHLDQRKQGR